MEEQVIKPAVLKLGVTEISMLNLLKPFHSNLKKKKKVLKIVDALKHYN